MHYFFTILYKFGRIMVFTFFDLLCICKLYLKNLVFVEILKLQ